MKFVPTPLVISIVILCVCGVRSVTGLPDAFVADDHGELTPAAHAGGIVGAVIGVLVCFGFAYAQWSTRGRWGFGIGIFAGALLVMQSVLMYLAISSGRVSLNAGVVAKFISFTVVGGLALCISSFISYAQRPNRSA